MKFKWENVCDDCKRKAIIIIFKASGKSKRRWLRGDPKSSDLGNCVSKRWPWPKHGVKSCREEKFGEGDAQQTARGKQGCRAHPWPEGDACSLGWRD